MTLNGVLQSLEEKYHLLEENKTINPDSVFHIIYDLIDKTNWEKLPIIQGYVEDKISKLSEKIAIVAEDAICREIAEYFGENNPNLFLYPVLDLVTLQNLPRDLDSMVLIQRHLTQSGPQFIGHDTVDYLNCDVLEFVLESSIDGLIIEALEYFYYISQDRRRQIANYEWNWDLIFAHIWLTLIHKFGCRAKLREYRYRWDTPRKFTSGTY